MSVPASLKMLTICNPLLDISADIEPEFLTKYGLNPADAVLASPEQLALFPELVSKYPVKYLAGGSGLNTTRVAQVERTSHKHIHHFFVPALFSSGNNRVLQFFTSTPETFGFFGCIGRDADAEILKRESN
jgi:hypothetical protein